MPQLWISLQGCILLSLFKDYYSIGTQCQNSFKIWASLRVLASLLTVPFPGEAKSRMWGYEVFFSSCTTCAGCTFIYRGDGLTTETRVLVPRGGSAGTYWEGGFGPNFWCWFRPPAVCRPGLLLKLLGCSSGFFLHLRVPPPFRDSVPSIQNVWSQPGFLQCWLSMLLMGKLINILLCIITLNFSVKELVSLDEGRRNGLHFF